MGLIIVGFQGAQKGIAADETGLNTQGFSVRFYPQFKDYLANFQGQNRAFAVPSDLTREVTVTGQAGGSNGLMAATFVTAYVFANTTNTFTTNNVAPVGGFYADEVTIGQTFNGWKEYTGKFTSDPLIT